MYFFQCQRIASFSLWVTSLNRHYRLALRPYIRIVIITGMIIATTTTIIIFSINQNCDYSDLTDETLFSFAYPFFVDRDHLTFLERDRLSVVEKIEIASGPAGYFSEWNEMLKGCVNRTKLHGNEEVREIIISRWIAKSLEQASDVRREKKGMYTCTCGCA